MLPQMGMAQGVGPLGPRLPRSTLLPGGVAPATTGSCGSLPQVPPRLPGIIQQRPSEDREEGEKPGSLPISSPTAGEWWWAGQEEGIHH